MKPKATRATHRKPARKKSLPQPSRAEAALRETNERLQLALAASKMGIWTRELIGRKRVLWSPELEAIFGLKAGEFAGTEQALMERIHPEDRAALQEAMAAAIK